MRKWEWLDRTADTMMTATHSADSVVPKAIVATAREATMQIAVRSLFCAIYGGRTAGDKKRETRYYAEFKMHFIFNLRGKMGEKLDLNIKNIFVYCLIFATQGKPGPYIA
jgi:hypothetical protein